MAWLIIKKWTDIDTFYQGKNTPNLFVAHWGFFFLLPYLIALKIMIMALNLTTKPGIRKRKLPKLVLTSHICSLSEHAFAIAYSFGLQALWSELISNIKQMAAEGTRCIITLPAECSKIKQIRSRRNKKAWLPSFKYPHSQHLHLNTIWLKPFQIPPTVSKSVLNIWLLMERIMLHFSKNKNKNCLSSHYYKNVEHGDKHIEQTLWMLWDWNTHFLCYIHHYYFIN